MFLTWLLIFVNNSGFKRTRDMERYLDAHISLMVSAPTRFTITSLKKCNPSVCICQGESLLVQYVTSNLPYYHIKNIKKPYSVVIDIEHLQRNFIWVMRRIPTISWCSSCARKAWWGENHAMPLRRSSQYVRWLGDMIE